MTIVFNFGLFPGGLVKGVKGLDSFKISLFLLLLKTCNVSPYEHHDESFHEEIKRKEKYYYFI